MDGVNNQSAAAVRRSRIMGMIPICTISVARNPLPRSMGVIFPVVTRRRKFGSLHGLLGKLREKRDRHGDDDIIVTWHPKTHRAKALAAVVEDRAHLHGINAQRCNDDFRQNSSPQSVESEGCTIATPCAASPGKSGGQA